MSDDTLCFRINGNQNMDILPGIHGSFSTQPNGQLFGGITHTVLSDYGEMLFQGIPAAFGSIWLSRYHIDHTARLTAEANSASLEAMHLLSGNISFTPEGLAQPVAMKAAHWQLMYLPHVSNVVVLPAGARLTTLDFHFDPAWLQTLAPYFRDLDQFLYNIDRGRAITLKNQPIPILNHVANLIARFFESRHTERDQNLFLDRHLTDWIAASLESPFLEPPEPVLLTPAEEKRMLDLMAYMLENISEPLQISFLARQMQINEFKFKRGFKLLAGLPVHQWLVKQRLEKAMTLLKDPRLSLTEISYHCGYETLPAFTKAFRKHFTFPPSYFRRVP